MEKLDCLVIGAGVVGLAVARELARRGREVVIVERHALIGSETSSRNSEVIHAGLYYPTGSLKARTCVEGRERLYAFCESHGVPHRRCGKLVVASRPDQAERLAALHAKAVENGVSDAVMMSGADARAMEPEVECVAAMHSPSSGIVDSHSLMIALLGDAEAHGAMLALGALVAGACATSDGLEVEIGGASAMQLLCRTVVNAAGLGAEAVARRIEGLDPGTVPTQYLAKGHYFRLSSRSPFSRLIYPLPEPGGLGVHVTLDLGGQARFGPDVEWVDTLDYAVDPRRAAPFEDAIRTYWPALPEGALEPDYAGIRPKISGPGEPAQDFLVHGPRTHGVPGLVNLYGIESPGLTASIALAERVAQIESVTRHADGVFAAADAPACREMTEWTVPSTGTTEHTTHGRRRVRRALAPETTLRTRLPPKRLTAKPAAWRRCSTESFTQARTTTSRLTMRSLRWGKAPSGH